MTNKEIAEFVKSRDEAFVSFVKTDDLTKFYAHCKKYGQELPKDEMVIKAGILKAVQECTDISEEIKIKAAMKCIKLGFFPFANWHYSEVADED